ncbi:ATP synthase F(0) complex subunit B1, mitochondrial [Pyxicephalus adspersus]|uniref:ATP synthase F(0) complex subunit B1, mitochondrial n=1 Tax=Pyxicephalus adspersus TaxID=30357 RepID=UPI003B5AFD68
MKTSAPVVVGALNTCRSLHTGKPSLAPVPPLPEHPGKVRHGIIPEEFFQFLYPKTGVTGQDWWLFYVLMMPKIMRNQNHDCKNSANVEKLARCQPVGNRHILPPHSYWLMELLNTGPGRSYTLLVHCSDNNVAMILETNYRERLLNVYNDVKKRLDYQVALQHLLRRKEQEHMINWVEKNVVQSITPQQQKESIAKCITDLKLLSKKAQAMA